MYITITLDLRSLFSLFRLAKKCLEMVGTAMNIITMAVSRFD